MSFVIYAAAVWRLTHMIVHEAGPGRIFQRLRDAVDFHSYGKPSARKVRLPEWMSDGVHCVSCVSVWSAAALLFSPQPLLMLLAGSAVAKLIGDYFYGDPPAIANSEPVVDLSKVIWKPLDQDQPSPSRSRDISISSPAKD